MSDELKPQSIDSPEFERLLGAYAKALDGDLRSYASAKRALIAHIDAWGARLAAVPDGYVLLPEAPTTAMICAIEDEVDSQLIASALRPADMFRQDGAGIYEALLAAAPKPEAPCGS
jgi:hypothetical protein